MSLIQQHGPYTEGKTDEHIDTQICRWTEKLN